MAHLIRINYPLSSFNYHLSGTNVVNFNKIHRTVSEQRFLTRNSSGDEIANVNFLYDDTVHALKMQ